MLGGFRASRPLLLVFVVIATGLACDPNTVWTTPADTSAGQLDVKVVIVDNARPSDGKNVVTVQFLFDGKPVKFAGGETVTANGVALTENALLFAYVGRVGTVQPGSTYDIVYSRQGTSNTLQVTAAPRPVITNPAASSTITRSSNMTVTYTPANGTGIDAGASAGGTGLQRNVFEPDNGTYTGFDTTSIGTGAGTLSLLRKFEASPSGTGFKSVTTDYRVEGVIDVTWQ